MVIGEKLQVSDSWFSPNMGKVKLLVLELLSKILTTRSFFNLVHRLEVSCQNIGLSSTRTVCSLLVFDIRVHSL